MAMTLDDLNRRDAEITAHIARKIKAAYARKMDRRETRAAINEALTERDNLRGDMLRAFLK